MRIGAVDRDGQQRRAVGQRVAKQQHGGHGKQAVELAREPGQGCARPVAGFQVECEKDEALDLMRLHAACALQQA